MPSYFEKPALVWKKQFPKYFLGVNPFPEKGSLVEGKPDAAFCQAVYEKEVKRVLAMVAEEAAKLSPDALWVLRSEEVAQRDNLEVTTRTFRHIAYLKSPRFFPAYVLLPAVRGHLVQGMLRFFLDRLDLGFLRNCTYAFVYEELKRVAAEDTTEIAGLDVAELLDQIEETEGRVLDEILLRQPPTQMPGKEEEKEEESDDGSLTSDEGKEESERYEGESAEGEEPEDKSEERPEGAEIVKADLRKEPLLEFINKRLEEEPFGPLSYTLKGAINAGFPRRFFSKAEFGSDYAEAFSGMLKLSSYFYHKNIFVLDHMDGWRQLDDLAKAHFMGSVVEFHYLSAGKCMMIFAGPRPIFEEMRKNLPMRFREIKLDLGLVNERLESLSTEVKVGEVLTNFLQSDYFRQSRLSKMKKQGLDPLYPFVQSAVAELTGQCQGDVVEILLAAGKMIEAGKSAGYPIIDAEFVREVRK